MGRNGGDCIGRVGSDVCELDDGTRGGAAGGGGKGGGSLVETGSECIIFDSARKCGSPEIKSSSSSALGTISLRNSRSLEERAIEFLPLFAAEKRPKNRETAEGCAAGCISGKTSSGFAMASINGGGLAKGPRLWEDDPMPAIVLGGGVATFGGVFELLRSTLARGEALEVMLDLFVAVGVGRPGDGEPALVETGAGLVFLLPKKDISPPLGFTSGVDSIGASFSNIFHPLGVTSSSTIAGRDLTDISHEVEPLADRNCAIGLDLVKGTCLVILTASAMPLAAKLEANGVNCVRTMSSGSILSTMSYLYERD